MAVTFEATSHIDPVSTFFESSQEEERSDFSGAREANNADIGRIFQPHTTCQIGRAVSTVMTAKCDDSRLKTLH
jgi:hypothetical protein